MNQATRVALGLVLVGAVAGCRRSEEAQRGDSIPQPETTGTMTGMAGHTGMMSGAMMDSMHAHLSMIDTMSATGVKAILPTHRQMVDRMLTQISSDMRGMNMAADAGFTAMTDSIRTDLDRMATMSGSELRNAMSAHHQRMMRLMETNRDMMGRPRTQ